MTQPVAPHSDAPEPGKPLTMFGPDFPFAYDDYVRNPVGLGSIPHEVHGTEVAIVGGGVAGIVAAYELMKMGFRPVVYEADQIGGRMRSAPFEQAPGAIAELGAMRFPPSSTTLWEYFAKVAIETFPFPNPLAAATPSTVVDLKGETYYARTLDELPAVFTQVADAWRQTLEDSADLHAIQTAIRERDVPTLKFLWDKLIRELDDQTFYGFLAASKHFPTFSLREIFGKVGFGTGGWDTDYPSSMLEILRIVLTEADDNHRGVIGGSQQLPLRLWKRTPRRIAHWPDGTSLESLHEGDPRPAVTSIRRTHPRNYTIADSSGEIRTYPAVIVTAQSWMLLNNIHCDDDLFPADLWAAIEQTHYMGSSKVFVLVDRPFWKDKVAGGRDSMSMTLTDRMSRGTYLLGHGDGPAVMCLSYTWEDDSRKIVPLDANERMELMLKSLRAIYPNVDIRSHIIGTPKTISWETERHFMGAFKANLPGHYRYQERLYTHFMQRDLSARHRGIYLAGDDISWTAGWAEGAITTALNAVWGVMNQFDGQTSPANPGPGDLFDDIAPLRLSDDI
ncbi:flavin monoamine oxidase family protein [Smaragdicoccus niigatensis]|uniref:flavin monoamine oxidase family protein n=1 Tax=Smaragdicoccus niigatensis TaxID=359359 RepID=UPI0003A654E8|nr:NAD(P)/FAD-dependent oxidoreductase [Smaragdicoccus niigatensis]